MEDSSNRVEYQHADDDAICACRDEKEKITHTYVARGKQSRPPIAKRPAYNIFLRVVRWSPPERWLHLYHVFFHRFFPRPLLGDHIEVRRSLSRERTGVGTFSILNFLRHWRTYVPACWAHPSPTDGLRAPLAEILNFQFLTHVTQNRYITLSGFHSRIYVLGRDVVPACYV